MTVWRHWIGSFRTESALAQRKSPPERFWGVIRSYREGTRGDTKDPKENRPLMLQCSQWEALREPAKAHSCVPDKIVEAFIEVHPGSEPAPGVDPRSGAGSAQLRAQARRASRASQGGKVVARGDLLITPGYVNFVGCQENSKRAGQLKRLPCSRAWQAPTVETPRKRRRSCGHRR